MSSSQPDPIREALPPATDYLTYLTILEYNLSIENLGTLNEVLQDVTLTINIGWDLVHLLLPFLPHSEACLQTIARLGNPREVLLKVTESLRLIAAENLSFDSEKSESGDEDVSKASRDGEQEEASTHTNTIDHEAHPTSTLKFTTLLSMLAILHARIKTKHPSRFLATTLQAVVAAISSFKSEVSEVTPATISFISALLSGDMHTEKTVAQARSSAVSDANNQTDPEASHDTHTTGDIAIQTKLLLSFVTYIVEVYATSLCSEDDVPGWCWSSRFQDKFEPHKIVPGKPTYTDMFKNDDRLRGRDQSIEAFAQLGDDLGSTVETLIHAASCEPQVGSTSHMQLEEEPPTSPEEIPLSQDGSLVLLAHKLRSEVHSVGTSKTGELNIFPGHCHLLCQFVGAEKVGGLATAGTEQEPLLDSVIVIGLIALHDRSAGEPGNDEQFNTYLQRLSLLSANCPSPSLRFHAHQLTSKVLHQHHSDRVRLAFIKDTLENCPYENLRASAVGWMKDEILSANSGKTDTQEPGSLFTTPVALQTTTPVMFPDLTQEFGVASVADQWMTIKINLSFYLAALNFYYLLLSSPVLINQLQVAGLHSDNDIGGSYIGPLREACNKVRKDLMDGGDIARMEGENALVGVEMDVMLLEDVLSRVERGIFELQRAG